MLTASQKDLIIDYISKDISRASFLASYPVPVNERYVEQLFQDAMLEEDAEAVECICYLHEFADPGRVLHYIRTFIKEPWHYSHENLALSLQTDYKDPDCVDDVVAAMHIQCEYWYNDGDAFIRKCAYVLGKLKTAYAYGQLEILTHDENEIIRKYALHQLKIRGTF